MNCKLNAALILEYAVGEPSLEERQEVEVHLASCAECRAEVRFHRSLSRDLKDLPQPAFPPELEEVLVRAAIQTRRSLPKSTVAARSEADGRSRWLPILCGAAGLAIVGLLVLLLLPGRVFSPGSVDEMVYGGSGRTTNVMSDAFMLIRNLRQGWELLAQFLSWCSPVARALGSALEAVGAARWSALVGTVVAAVLVLRRFTRKRDVGHAKARGL